MASLLHHAIENITAQSIQKYRPEKIILFGSAARADAAPGSDIDLLIIKRDTPPIAQTESWRSATWLSAMRPSTYCFTAWRSFKNGSVWATPSSN
jgi:hypothetical protein